MWAWEAKAGTRTWRSATGEARGYLGQMVEWGYEPSEVEQLILAPQRRPGLSNPTKPPGLTRREVWRDTLTE